MATVQATAPMHVHVHRARKVRMLPTREQRHVLDRWLLGAKKTWNMAVCLVNTHPSLADAPVLDRLVVTAAALKAQHHGAGWVVTCPSAIRKGVVRRLVANVASARTNGKGRRFRMHPIPYADRGNGILELEHQYTEVGADWVRPYAAETLETNPKSAWYTGRIALRVPKRERHPIPIAATRDVKILKERGRYYFVYVAVEERAAESLCPDAPDAAPVAGRIVALDPGVRTFMTGFDAATGETLEFGDAEFRKRIDASLDRRDAIDRVLCDDQRRLALYRREQRLRPDASATELKRRYHRRLRSLRAGRIKYEQRAKNAVRDMHWKTATALLSRFEHVILPRFSSRNIHQLHVADATKRYARVQGHFAFRQRLLHKAWASFPSVRVWLCGEHYTTKTCGACGTINDIKGEETFRCSARCGLTAPRDAHAARNIYLKICFGTHDGLKRKR